MKFSFKQHFKTLETLKKLEDEVKRLKKKSEQDFSSYVNIKKEFDKNKEKYEFAVAKYTNIITNLENKNRELTQRLEELQLKFTETKNELKITKANEIEFRNQLLETMKLNNQLNTRTTETTIVETESKTK